MTTKEFQNIRNTAQIMIDPIIAVNDAQAIAITDLEDAETAQALALANELNRPVLADADGKLKLDTYFDDFVVPLTSGKIGANAKPDFDYTNVGYLFPQNDTSEKLYLIIQLPHKYMEGSDVYPHVHFKQTSADAPVFKIEYTWFNPNGVPAAPTTVYTMNEYAFEYTSGNLHQIAKGATPIDGTDKKISSLLLVVLYRDDNVVTGDVLAWQFDLHIECDTLGSQEEYVK